MEPIVTNDDEIEIDLGMLLRVIISKIFIIAMVSIICGLAGFIYSSFVVSKQYESTAQLYIINRQNEGTTTLSDIQSSTQLVKDYQVLVVSRPVVEQVISNLQLNVKTENFIQNVHVNIASDSRVLRLSVTNTDPYKAKEIVDNLADVSAERICDVMQIGGINIIEYGNIPMNATSPNVQKFTLLGFLVGLVLSAGLVILFYMLDDTINTSEDIEKYLGISTLAIIPLSEIEYDGEQINRNKRG